MIWTERRFPVVFHLNNHKGHTHLKLQRNIILQLVCLLFGPILSSVVLIEGVYVCVWMSSRVFWPRSPADVLTSSRLYTHSLHHAGRFSHMRGRTTRRENWGEKINVLSMLEITKKQSQAKFWPTTFDRHPLKCNQIVTSFNFKSLYNFTNHKSVKLIHPPFIWSKLTGGGGDS